MFKIVDLYGDHYNYLRGFTAKQYKDLCTCTVDDVDTLYHFLSEDLCARLKRNTLDVYEMMYYSFFLVALSVNDSDLEHDGKKYPVFHFLNDFRIAVQKKNEEMKRYFSGYNHVVFTRQYPKTEQVINGFKDYYPISSISDGKENYTLASLHDYREMLKHLPANGFHNVISYPNFFSLQMKSDFNMVMDPEFLKNVYCTFFPKEWIRIYHDEMEYLVRHLNYSNEYIDNLYPLEYKTLETKIKEKLKQDEQQSES